MIRKIGILILGMMLLYILWIQLVLPIVKYLKAGFAIGFDKVAFVYKPFTGQSALLQWSSKKYGNSYGFYLERVQKNPMLKIIILKLNIGTQFYIVDPQMIKKMTNDHYKLLPKPMFMIFGNQIDTGLVFSEGELWKNSRAILSNLFHFEKIKSREPIMEKVINQKIQNLDKQNPHLFKLGCSIGGQIVVKALFGEEFFEVKFGSLNPYQEIQQLMAALIDQTRSFFHIGRLILFGKVTKSSRFLLPSQKKILVRLLAFKETCRQYLFRQKERYVQGVPVPPFLEAYFKLNDDSYFQEIIHQLFLFLFAGEDTTGSLIEICLAVLATYPEFQDSILEDAHKSGIYNSRELSNFINEINRRRGSIPVMASRMVLKPFTVDGFTFQKGYRALMAMAGPMINPKYWDDPDLFNPSRFNSSNENPNVFIPFSSGPRNCIGQHMALMEVKLALVRILQKYRLVKTGNSLATQTNTIINYLVDSHYVRFEQK